MELDEPVELAELPISDMNVFLVSDRSQLPMHFV